MPSANIFRFHRRGKLFQTPAAAFDHWTLSCQLLRSPRSSRRVCTVPPPSEPIPRSQPAHAGGLFLRPISRPERRVLASLHVVPEGSESTEPSGLILSSVAIG